MAADFKVDAELVVHSKGAATGLNALSSKLAGFASTLKGTEGAFGGMVGQAIAFGSAYVGVGAMVSGFSALASSAFEFQKEVGGARLGLQTIMSQVEGLGQGIADPAERMATAFAQAGPLADQTYRRLQDMAITSSATSAELLQIFQSTYGAAKSAGASMDQVFELTANASTAGAALGVDMQQASRDMGAMLRGGAGLDVKLFSALRSMNAITVDAQDFNALNPADRVAMLANALRGFEAANEAYGRSLPGALSTSQDLFELFRGSFFGPTFSKMADLLNELNAYLIEHREVISAYMERAGAGMARFLLSGLQKAHEVFDYVVAHWDEIAAKFHAAVDKAREVMPMILAAGETYVKLRLAAVALGSAFQAGAWISSALGSLSSFVGFLGEAGVLGGSAAAAGGTAAAGAAGGSAAAAGGATAMMGPLAAIVGAIVLVMASVREAWVSFQAYFAPAIESLKESFGAAGTEFMDLIMSLYESLKPFFRLIGGPIVAAVIAAFRIMAMVLRWVIAQARLVVWVFGKIVEYIQPAIDFLAEAFTLIITKIGDLAGWFDKFITKIREWMAAGDDPEDDYRPSTFYRSDEVPGESYYDAQERRLLADHSLDAPEGRPTTVNDFRGSKISVAQSFREADPDRVALRMIEDISRFAEQRIQSGYAPAFTR